MNHLLKTLILTAGMFLGVMQSENSGLYAQLSSEQQNQVDQYNQLIENYIAQNQQKVASYYATKKAGVYINAGNNEKAIESYLEASQLNSRIGNDLANVKIYNNVAMIYSDLNQLNKTLEYFDRSLIISRRYDKKEEIALSLMDLASVLLIKKKYDTAIEKLIEALKLLDKINDPKLLRTCYNLLAQSYKGTGDNKKHEEYYDYFKIYDEFLKEDNQLAENNTQVIAEKKLQKENTEAKVKDILPSEPNETSINIDDSLNLELADAERIISSMNVENDALTEKSNAENGLSQEKKKYRIWLIAGVIGLLTILTIGIILMIRQKRKN